MSGVTSISIVGVKRCTTPGGASATRSASGKPSASTNAPVELTHHDEQLGLHDMQLAREPRSGLLGVLCPELEAIGAVDREGVDAEPLQ